MLEKKYRLPWEARFVNGRLVSDPYFNVRVKSNSLLFNRVGIVISKKIDKRAVVRNRMKRLIYSIIQEIWKNIQPGYDVLFVIRKDAVEAKREDFYSSIKQVFLKEKMLI